MSFAADMEEAGRALFGEHWQSPLARELAVQLRTLQRWQAGTSRPGAETEAGVRQDLRRLLLARGVECRRVARRVGGRVHQNPAAGR